jgi:hypothetical protein
MIKMRGIVYLVPLVESWFEEDMQGKARRAALLFLSREVNGLK